MLRFNVEIERDIFREVSEIYITKTTESGRQVAQIQWKDLPAEAMPRVERVEPTLAIEHGRDEKDSMGAKFLEKFWQELSYVLKKDVSDPKVEGLQATLKTQEKHLEDMRMMVVGFGCKLVGPQVLNDLNKVLKNND